MISNNYNLMTKLMKPYDLKFLLISLSLNIIKGKCLLENKLSFLKPEVKKLKKSFLCCSNEFLK